MSTMVDPSTLDHNSNNSENKRSRTEASHDNDNTNTNGGDGGSNNVDSFLSSMTFAAGAPGGAMTRGMAGCDCDECGGSAFIPADIVEALRKHKRMRKEQRPMKRSQVRELVQRHHATGTCVYKLTLPQASDPLVEFGSSHRLVWIKYLPSRSILKTIGTGIVGSQDEERGRKELDWQQGDVYLVPSNGGKAVAWLHEKETTHEEEEQHDEIENDKEKASSSKGEASKSRSSSNSNNTSGHAIMYVCKVPLDSLQKEGDSEKPPSEEDGPPEWHEIIRETCREVLDSNANEMRNNSADGNDKKALMKYYKLGEDPAAKLRQTLSSL